MAQLDEASIREEVQGREPDFEILEDWRTPSGNLRNAPMYEAEISNEYLRARKVVNGRTPAEVRDKAIRQLQQWENQEIRRRTAEAKDDLRAKAVQATEDAQAAIQEMREILHATLSRDDRLD
jgi:hypothetical protein